jgi:hypothetical protein
MQILAGVLAIFRFVMLRHIHRTRAAYQQKSVGTVAPGLHSVNTKLCDLPGWLLQGLWLLMGSLYLGNNIKSMYFYVLVHVSCNRYYM